MYDQYIFYLGEKSFVFYAQNQNSLNSSSEIFLFWRTLLEQYDLNLTAFILAC